MKKWQIITVSLLLLVLVGFSACSPFGEDEKTVEQQVEVARGDLMVSVSGSGNIEAAREAKLTFGSGGRIDKIYIDEGDEVSQGDVLAKLETDTLELAKTQADVALTQAQVALTQAQLAQKTAEYNLDTILDGKDALELALFNAQITLRTAEHSLDETQDIYTWPDIKTAQTDVENAEAFLDYVLDEELSTTAIAYAQARLAAAEAVLDAKIHAYDTEEVAIAKMQVEADEMAEAQAQQDLDKLADTIALNELQVKAAEESVKQAQHSITLAQASLKEAQRQLDEATIVASFDGVIASVNAEEGDILPSPAMSPQPVIYVIDSSTMELVVEVDEIDVPEIKLGQKAVINLDALPDADFTGIVATIFPMPREVGGVVVYDVKIELKVPEDSGVKIGMSAETDIVLAERSNVLLVPDRAINKDSEGNTVIGVVINEEVEERPVVAGISDGFDTEIISGLREGEMVLTEVKVK
ncbi:efflux RND transporter periplasmic adaptor subunit [Chloroflexota bacterium]